jgi:hypothetical protein
MRTGRGRKIVSKIMLWLIFAHFENQYFASDLTESKSGQYKSGFKCAIDCIGQKCD